MTLTGRILALGLQWWMEEIGNSGQKAEQLILMNYISEAIFQRKKNSAYMKPKKTETTVVFCVLPSTFSVIFCNWPESPKHQKKVISQRKWTEPWFSMYSGERSNLFVRPLSKTELGLWSGSWLVGIKLKTPVLNMFNT